MPNLTSVWARVRDCVHLLTDEPAQVGFLFVAHAIDWEENIFLGVFKTRDVATSCVKKAIRAYPHLQNAEIRIQPVALHANPFTYSAIGLMDDWA